MSAPQQPAPSTETSNQRTAGWLAERATLGALLHTPHRITALRSWLRPHDFADPLHQAVYATIDRLHASGRLGTAVDGLADGRPTTTDNLRAVYHDLRSAQTVNYRTLLDLYATGNLARTDTHLRYGRMVLETSVRRQLQHWAVRLQPLQAHDLLTHLAGLTAQVQRSHGQPVVHLPTAVPAGGASQPDASETPTLPRRLVERAERHLIHAALTEPPERQTALLHQFQPHDFVASPRHADTWHAMRTLAERGDPVDAITVAWELETQTANGASPLAPSRPAGLSPEVLATMIQPPAGNTDRPANLVQRSAIAHHANHARQHLIDLAQDRRHSLEATLAAARDTAASLGNHQDRLASRPSHERQHIQLALEGDGPAVRPLPTISRPGRTL